MPTSDTHPEKDSTSLILNRLKDIATAVMHAAEAGTLEKVLERIAHVAGELVNARYTALGVPDDEGGLRYFKVAGITPQQMSRLDHLPAGHGLLGVIMHERKVVRLTRMQDDTRSGGFCSGHPKMTSLLGVPVQLGERLFGILYLCDRLDGQPFSEQDEWLIETVAGYAALAIAGSELSEQQSRLILLEERERISLELHDGIIQSLYAIGMHLDLARTAPNPTGDELKPAMDGLNTVIEDIRRYIMNLKVNSPHQETVHEFLRDILARLYVPEDVTVEIDAPHSPPPFTSPVFEAVGQMTNEAISNALRHANATHIQISALESDGIFQVTVSDNGRGFDLNKITENSGLGLQNLQRRALRHGGQIRLDTAPGQGTRLTIQLPVLRG